MVFQGLGQNVVEIVIRAKDDFSKNLDTLQGKLQEIRGGAIALSAVGGGITALGVASLKTAGEFEQTEIAFTTMLGSAEKADTMLRELADFAKKTPFTLKGIEKTSKQLLAMGIEEEKLLETTRMLGDVSAGLNVPIERLALNFGQVAAQGKLTGRELRDFRIAGFDVIQELTEITGKSREELEAMVSEGAITFEMVEAAFKNATSEGGRFFNLMDSLSETTLGKLSNLQDSIEILGRVIGEVVVGPASDLLSIIVPIVEKIGEWAEEHPNLTKVLVIATAAMGAMALAIGGIALALSFATPAAIAFLLAVSPWILVFGGIVAAIVAVILIVKKVKDNWVEFTIGLSSILTKFETFFVRVFGNIGNFFIKVWNFMVEGAASRVNIIIGFINRLIDSFNAIAGRLGFSTIGRLGEVSFGGLKLDLIDIDEKIADIQRRHNDLVMDATRLKMLEKAREETEKQTKELTKQEQLVKNLSEFALIPSTGDIFKLNSAVVKSDFKTREAFEIAANVLRGKQFVGAPDSGFNAVNISIENVNGLDPDEVSRALNKMLKDRGL